VPVTLLALAALAPTPVAAASCESLLSLSLPHTTISLAQSVPPGTFTPPVGAPLTGLPAFCRVVGASHPTSDSNIGFEVWIPSGADWNVKYLQVGNGGFAGSIPYGALANALRRGYATAGTDDGHVAGGTNATWALGHPEKIIDFGYRALKETTDSAKAIIAALTATHPHRSYFFGCSDGGREALMEAQRFPGDFDGIIAGAPANFWTHLLAAGAWTQQALLETPQSYIPPAKLPAVQAAALAACDLVEDGVQDSIVADPRDCHFDPTVLQCTGADSNACLTGPQVTALKKIYAGPHNPRTGELIHPGYEAGAEAPAASFTAWETGPSLASIGNALLNQFSVNFFRFMVFDDSTYDIRHFNFDSDMTFTDHKSVNGQSLASVLNSTNPDLSAFQSHGGKLIHYHGWNDPAIGPRNSINYYESVASVQRPGKGHGKGEDKVGLRRTQDFYRLFMVPGMLHCGGGPGPNNFGQGTPLADADHDVVKALEQWVEHGIAPDRIVSTKFIDDNPASGVALTRPLCPYPQVALWTGIGDTNDAANFVCVDDERGSTD
jgi:feruloyl esterase